MDVECVSATEATYGHNVEQLRNSCALPPSPAPNSSVAAPGARAEQLRDAFALISPQDLADLLDVDERTLAVWRCQRKGPDFVKLGRTVFYRRRDVEAWIDLKTTPTDRAA
jgi:hypothetical protein